MPPAIACEVSTCLLCVQGSPTLLNKDKESYRHAVAVTSWRNGKNGEPFLYTLNLACPEERWPDLEPMFQQSIASFRLTSPTKVGSHDSISLCMNSCCVLFAAAELA